MGTDANERAGWYALLHHPLAGVGLLSAATVAALVWANSPWGALHEALFSTPLRVGLGDLELEKPLLLWVNDGLMGIFFFLVGLEIKRELLAGELNGLRQAALPAIAAVGGMVVPAGLYLLVQAGGPGARGWGVPMATDIAFALGALAVLGRRVPAALKVFLTAVAIVDDIGAVLVIAVAYTDTIVLVSLLAGLALFAVAIAANRFDVRSPVLYFLLGTAVWLAFLQSGVHATVAALLMALTIPARTRIDGEGLVREVRAHLARLHEVGLPSDTRLNTPAQQGVLTAVGETLERSEAPLQRLEHALHPVVTFGVLPLFALANAGVRLDGDPTEVVTDPIAIGIVVGLVVGKPIGIGGFARAAVALGLADLPEGVRWRHVFGAGALAGIGFTMALFIGSLAFDDPGAVVTAKLAIVGASVLSAAVGASLLARAPQR
ncbi:MAG TPA: Na+/H+ antiporter NhaA [Sandaracinaceae bacterium LLY-WYZ-13_1]|nr:Na+/H+ antiporter NhaA [Sandaracinaceae bacterium LLY-WYZ-13_1]